MAGEPEGGMNRFRKALSYLLWGGQIVGLNDRDNFETNRVTLADYNDVVGPEVAAGFGAASAGLRHATVYACVDLVAGTGGSLPVEVTRKGPNGVRTPAYDHPLYRLLHDSPNADQTALDFWEFMLASVELQGNAYAEIARGSGGVVALTPIVPDRIRAHRLASGDIEYEWSENGHSRSGTQANVFHIRGFGGTALRGASRLALCRTAFGAAFSVEQAAVSTFRNAATPSGVLQTEMQLTPEQRSEAEDLLRKKYQGAMRAGVPMLLDKGLTWKSITINPEDAQMLETRKFSVEEICRLFSVPPHMVGHTESSTSWGTGLEQQTMGFQKFTLRRRLKRVEAAAEKWLLTPADVAEGIRIEFNLEGLLRADSDARAKYYNAGLQNGWMTINEVRALEGLPPVEGGDVPRMQIQNVPITEAGNAVAPQGGK
jgi:HK97 family phage portal protein